MKKTFVIISVFFIILLVGIEVYVQSDAFALRIRPMVVDRLQEVFGGKAEIGWVGANFIPMYLEVRDVSLRDDRGKAIAAVRKIKTYINPIALVFQRINLPSIVIVEPRLFMERSKDGELNLSPIIDKINRNIENLPAKGGPTGFRVTIGTISIIQGQITIADTGSSIRVEASGIQLRVSANLAGESMKFELKSPVVRVHKLEKVMFSGNLRATLWFDHGRYRLDSSELKSDDTEISLTGEVGERPDAKLNLQLRVRSGPQTMGRFFSADLIKQVNKEQLPHIEASLSIRGNSAKPVIKGVVTLAGISYQGIKLREASLSFDYVDQNLTLVGERWKLVRGNKNAVIDSVNGLIGYGDHGFDIHRLDIVTEDLSMKIEGKVDPQNGFNARLIAESSDKGRTLSFLTAVPLEGRIVVHGHLTGALNAPLFDGTISAGPVAVRGIRFDTAEGGLQYKDKRISIASVEIRQKASRYVLHGFADFSGEEALYSAQVRMLRSDVASVVALFYRPLPLKLTATGDMSFDGTSHAYSGSARLAVDSGSAYGESLAKGFVVASLTKDKISFTQVRVDKGNGIVSGSGWIGFDGSYSATISSRGVKLSEVDLLADVPVDGLFDLKINSTGTFAHPKVSASFISGGVQYNRIDLGGLAAELEIDHSALICNAQLAGNQAGITVRSGLTEPFAWTAQLKLNTDTFDPFALFSGKTPIANTRLVADGNVSLRGNGMDISSVSGEALFERLGLAVGDYHVENVGNAAVTIKDGRLSATSLVFQGPGTNLAVTGDARLRKDMDFSFRGTVHLSLLRILYREVEHGDGTAEVKLTVKDDWKNPDVAGELSIKNGEIKIKDIPQKFSALRGKLTFAQNRIVVDSLSGEAGGGTLSASGWAQLNGLALRDFSVKSSFENVTVRYPEGLTSTLSGDLYYDGDSVEQSLNGEILIKRAKYDKRVEWKSMLVDIGKGLYQKKKTEVAWIGDTEINIRFHGRDNILLQNNLAKLPLDVDVFLRGTVNQPQLLGRIEALSGTVYFRKNEFNILHASADFVDPIHMNPVLDIQAEIQVREYRIRLAVSGTADRAVVTLLSDPALSDSDILSLLALGKVGSELQGKESGVGMSEAYSLATGQLQDIVESRARSLTGLDRFQVDPYVTRGDVSVPRVTVGKEIVRDRLYVTYSSNVGSTTPEQIFRIEYILSRHFSLVGERNELGNTGADVKYRFVFR